MKPLAAALNEAVVSPAAPRSVERGAAWWRDSPTTALAAHGPAASGAGWRLTTAFCTSCRAALARCLATAPGAARACASASPRRLSVTFVLTPAAVPLSQLLCRRPKEDTHTQHSDLTPLPGLPCSQPNRSRATGAAALTTHTICSAV